MCVCVRVSRSYCFYNFDTKRRRHALRAVLCNITATVHIHNIIVSNLQNRIRCTIRVVFHVPDAHTHVASSDRDNDPSDFTSYNTRIIMSITAAVVHILLCER